ncbi:MAG: hypothetical protein IT481_01145 [Gammaproteobacteria bacterium]|nr:hypothetical protein [Gammaproteobacteria bacterium]
MPPSPPPETTAQAERRQGRDRRRSTLRALLIGGIRQRRRAPRRDNERHLAALDWHHPQWLAVGLLILLLSVADAFLTITLVNLGASEANPLMEPLVHGADAGFVYWKMALTSGGVALLILLARMHAFGRIPVAAILYGVLLGYIVLISYEIWLLEHLAARAWDG